MKIKVFFPLIFIVNSLAFPAASLNEQKFVKGSLADKIQIMQKLSEKETVPVAKRGLDFAIENADILASDKDLAKLVIACVKVFPSDPELIAKIPADDLKKICERFMTVFKLFKNKELKAAVMEKLELYSSADSELAVAFLNDYLSTAFKVGKKTENVIEGAIVSVGRIGNEESLSIIYNIWSSNIWPEYQAATDEALVLLSQDSFSDVIKILSLSKIEDFARFFSLLHKSSKKSQKSLCEIAENALLIAINNAEKLKASGKDSERAFASFQLEAQKILSEYSWSHAANVVNSNILLAKKAYDEGSMDEADFVKMIGLSVKIPSSALAQSLTDMLLECNGKVEKADKSGDVKMPAKSVVLALISALGVLGDKTSFDALLYVTYLSYPPEVVDEAKKSLAQLNW
ncbi:hypothetical protein [uncultured Treponema sp.]|uniref:hypothetical protein n=1 Tax=uncultured Treponema sp. TaxID=162155 RepID=UPI0025EBE359|nr:hypothetical protein [uncultured Treponema sp.]